jgi:ATP-binding cassette subfamily F protein uup
MVLIGMRDVCVGFGVPLLLDHVNFHIERRERVCLFGGSGTGKSTLMRLLNGNLAPDEGERRWNCSKTCFRNSRARCCW